MKGPSLKERMSYRKKFEAILKKVKGKGPYDILVCYSGGKDSTYVLEALTRMYGLKILAFTFDNGFIPDRAYANIRAVVGKLGVDHMILRFEPKMARRLFRRALKGGMYPPKALERASAVCTSCMGLIKYSALKAAIEMSIPVVAYGWSPGQAPLSSSILKLEPSMARAMEMALKKPMMKACGKAIGRYFLDERHYRRPEKFPYYAHPLAFLGYDTYKIEASIKKLGWVRPKGLDANSSNCILNTLAVAEHIKLYGRHPHAYEVTRLKDEGYITGARARHMLEERFSDDTLKEAMERLGL